jgi:hypothetical protein
VKDKQRLSVYLSHRYGGDPENLRKARAWLDWLTLRFPDVEWRASWIASCEVTPETPEAREAGLRACEDEVRGCDALLRIGAASDGTRRERGAYYGARHAVELPTHCIGIDALSPEYDATRIFTFIVDTQLDLNRRCDFVEGMPE